MTRPVADLALRYGWTGASRRSVVRERIAAALSAWLSDWHVAQGGATPCMEDAPIVPYSPDEACVLHSGTSGTGLMVAAARDDLVPLGNWLAGIRESQATLSKDIGKAALHDLALRIARLAQTGEVLEHGQDAWPQALTREEFGAIGFAFDAGGIPISVVLARNAVDALCPMVPSAGPVHLRSRWDAAASVRLRLTAGFDFGAIRMRELTDLRVGEVLVGECPLDTQVRVSAPGGAPLGNARMGRLGHLRAVAMDEPSQIQENHL